MGKDPSRIRDEIAATRDRMDDTLDALQYRTDVPARVGDRFESIKDAVGDAEASVVSAAGDAAASVASRASDMTLDAAAALGSAVATAKHAIADAIPGATPSGASTSLLTTAEDDIDVQED